MPLCSIASVKFEISTRRVWTSDIAFSYFWIIDAILSAMSVSARGNAMIWVNIGAEFAHANIGKECVHDRYIATDLESRFRRLF